MSTNEDVVVTKLASDLKEFVRAVNNTKRLLEGHKCDVNLHVGAFSGLHVTVTKQVTY